MKCEITNKESGRQKLKRVEKLVKFAHTYIVYLHPCVLNYVKTIRERFQSVPVLSLALGNILQRRSPAGKQLPATNTHSQLTVRFSQLLY